MKITSIELSKYKRLALSNITKLVVNPHEKLQLILGTNGSGKSSLLKELTPLPANPQDYEKEGYKIIYIEHNKHDYLLKNIFATNGNIFSFIKNNEELNPGKTVTVYRELVKREFGITQIIHDVMIGNVNFSTMSSLERRNWFTLLSKSDYTYAIGYYQRIKEQLRDIQGGIKLTQSRLVLESERVLSSADEATYKNDIAEMRKFIDYLIELKTSIAINKPFTDIAVVENNISLLSDSIMKAASFKPYCKYNEMDVMLVNTKAALMSAQQLYNELCGIITDLQSSHSKLSSTNTESYEDIVIAIETTSKEIAYRKQHILLPIVFDNNSIALQSLMNVYELVANIVTVIDSNEDRKYSRELFSGYQDSSTSLNLQLNELKKLHDNLVTKNNDLIHLRDHNKTECPKCTHTWSRGYNHSLHETVRESLTAVITDINIVTVKLDDVNELIGKHNEYLNLYRSYANIAKSWPVLVPLWNYINDNSLLVNNPKSIVKLMNDVKEDILLAVEVDKLNTRLASYTEIADSLMDSKNNSLTSLQADIDYNTNRLAEVNEAIKTNKDILARVTNDKSTIDNLITMKTKLNILLADRKEGYEVLIANNKIAYINEIITNLHVELSKKEAAINKVDIQKALVADMETQLQTMLAKASLLKMAVKELSPTEGLIAKGLTSFMNMFLSQMNDFIRKIWLYELTLLPVYTTDDEVDLDYKFQLQINDGIIISDIAKGSSAMKEVIDLAFKIISANHLGLSNAPIFLDEFGAKLDHSHRQAAFRLVTNLLTTANYSQMYMVSHYDHSYGSLKNAEMLVLCPNNIIIPKDAVYNKHAYIE